jgi:hypothetical protein
MLKRLSEFAVIRADNWHCHLHLAIERHQRVVVSSIVFLCGTRKDSPCRLNAMAQALFVIAHGTNCAATQMLTWTLLKPDIVHRATDAHRRSQPEEAYDIVFELAFEFLRRFGDKGVNIPA